MGNRKFWLVIGIAVIVILVVIGFNKYATVGNSGVDSVSVGHQHDGTCDSACFANLDSTLDSAGVVDSSTLNLDSALFDSFFNENLDSVELNGE